MQVRKQNKQTITGARSSSGCLERFYIHSRCAEIHVLTCCRAFVPTARSLRATASCRSRGTPSCRSTAWLRCEWRLDLRHPTRPERTTKAIIHSSGHRVFCLSRDYPASHTAAHLILHIQDGSCVTDAHVCLVGIC